LEHIELALSGIGKLLCDLESDMKLKGHTLPRTWRNPGIIECEFALSRAEITGLDLSALHVDELAETSTQPANVTGN